MASYRDSPETEGSDKQVANSQGLFLQGTGTPGKV